MTGTDRAGLLSKIDRERILWLIDHVGRVDRLTFEVLILLTAILAITASIVRLQFRLRNDHRFLLEDWLVLLGTACLIAETACLYHYRGAVYIYDAANSNADVYLWTQEDYELQRSLYQGGVASMVVYFGLAWGSIFAIKYSFLALFYRMIKKVKKNLTIFYWVTVAATTISALFIVLESFVLCPRFGADPTGKCGTKGTNNSMLGAGIVVHLLDIFSDLMIIAVPLILLRMSQLRFKHKVRIAITLSLSSICVILSAARLAGSINKNVEGQPVFGVVWIAFMLHCEAAVAVLTGSVPALRAIWRTHHQQRRTIYGGDDVETQTSLKSRALNSLAVTWGSAKSWPKRRDESEGSQAGHSMFALQPLCGMRPSQDVSSSQRRDDHDDADSDNQSIINSRNVHSTSRNSTHNQIRVTYETTILSEDASSHDVSGFKEAMMRSDLCLNQPELPAPVAKSTMKTMDYNIDGFGRIHAGLHI
ncbi:hypothetical protein K504DRAFT_399564 [Pleomassaria siparia CBS 279.74]|uniref:Rhodopsin domain-containing protein n=1 Tax=Pleomassaria siparia CBS 279.74 TaxID=1314801 RepID=A0A6G1KMR9_9PLEO|nr:hypothetical protein K504DRAFT_399564 [Pleomassaria siparia CBS 279.74]